MILSICVNSEKFNFDVYQDINRGPGVSTSKEFHFISTVMVGQNIIISNDVTFTVLNEVDYHAKLTLGSSEQIKQCFNSPTQKTCTFQFQSTPTVYDNFIIFMYLIDEMNESDVSCVNLINKNCQKPHEDKSGPCMKISFQNHFFHATKEHLIQSQDGWKLIRELKIGDILNNGIIENISNDYCQNLNSCIEKGNKFQYAGELFSTFSLITPDNYEDNFIY